jgi:hypothetical protein
MVRQRFVLFIQNIFSHFVINNVTDKTIAIDLVINGQLAGFLKNQGISFALQAEQPVATAI